MDPTQELWKTAVHEAGHAVIAAYLNPESVRSVTITPNAERAGEFICEQDYWHEVDLEGDNAILDRCVMSQLVDDLMIFVAGAVAESIFLDEVSHASTWWGDADGLTDLLGKAFGNRKELKDAALDFSLHRCRALLERPEFTGGVERIATALMEKHTLHRDEIFDLLRQPTQ